VAAASARATTPDQTRTWVDVANDVRAIYAVVGRRGGPPESSGGGVGSP
jgi:hypothetical protein